MSYQVLARKWRPRTFSQMVGQEHVLQALINALDQQRLHHAYLFSGTRGVGKTSLARILAKSLSCQLKVSATPCGECQACKDIDAGCFVDLIEVDAASRTKVEDTRELLDNVQYAPTQGRFKIYLIDEVHMLSNHSFNALLKTLEEPPEHVKFLLATTDPQKLPVTILSRCLQFNLKNMHAEQISKHLMWILEKENISYEESALNYIARSARGSMRDALSILDQAIAHTQQHLVADKVRTMLGYTDEQYKIRILTALADNDAQELMNISQNLSIEGADYKRTLESLLDVLHHLALLHALPDSMETSQSNETIRALIPKFDSPQIQLLYQIALKAHNDLDISPNQKTGFEMSLLRMLAFQPNPYISTKPQQPTDKTTPAPKSPQNNNTNDKNSTTQHIAESSSRFSQALANSNPQNMTANKKEPPLNAQENPVINSQFATAIEATNNKSSSHDRVIDEVPSHHAPAPIEQSKKHSLMQSHDSANNKPQQMAAPQQTPSDYQAPQANPKQPLTTVTQSTTSIIDWDKLITELKLKGMALNLAQHCQVMSFDGYKLQLGIAEEHRTMLIESIQSRLNNALNDYFSKPIRLEFLIKDNTLLETPATKLKQENMKKQQQAEQSISQDEHLKHIVDSYDATVVDGSITPIDP